MNLANGPSSDEIIPFRLPARIKALFKGNGLIY